MTSFDQEGVGARAAKLPKEKQVFFGLTCAERLVPCCWAFAQRQDWDLVPYREGCELVFSHLAAGRTVSLQALDAATSALEGVIPHSRDHGYPLAVQAQSGMLALLYCLELWRTGESSNAGNAAAAVVDALDNYEYFIHRTLRGSKESPTEYPLLDREVKWQAECLSILDQGPFGADAALDLRILNRSYTVPPAVPIE